MRSQVRRLLARVSEVDIAKSVCRQREVQLRALRRVNGSPGSVSEFNGHVKAAWRGAIVQQGRRALGRVSPAERSKSQLVNSVGILTKDIEVCRCRETLGDRHPATLVAINNYASLLMAAGEQAAACALYLEVHAVRREMLGEDHPATLSSQNNLGVSRFASGDLAQAATLLHGAVDKRRAALGAEHPSTLRTMYNLGSALKARSQGDDLKVAEGLLREVLDARRAALGRAHPDCLKAYNALGSLLYQRRETEAAISIYREAFTTGLTALGDRHPIVLTSMNNLGNALHTRGLQQMETFGAPADSPGKVELDEAAQLLRDALERSRDVLGAQHMDTLISSSNLGVLLRNRGDRLDEAKDLIRVAVEGVAEARTVLGDTHPHVSHMQEGLTELEA